MMPAMGSVSTRNEGASEDLRDRQKADPLRDQQFHQAEQLLCQHHEAKCAQTDANGEAAHENVTIEDGVQHGAVRVLHRKIGCCTIEESAWVVNRVDRPGPKDPLDKHFTPWYIAAHFSAGYDGSG